MNDKNIIVNKPEPKPGILERGDLFAIAVGMVIGSGMVTLIGPAMAYTGYSVWLAYLTAIVMGFFMVFPYIILGGTMRVAGGPYSHRNEPFRSQHRRSGSLYETGNADPQQFFCVGTGIVFE